MRANRDLVGEIEDAKNIIARRFASHIDYAVRTGLATAKRAEEIRALCPDWLAGVHEAVASNGHVEAEPSLLPPPSGHWGPPA